MCVRRSLPGRWDPCVSHGRSLRVCQEEVVGGQPPWRQRPRSGKVCEFCFQSCSRHATGLPQLVKTQTISQTSSPLPEEGPRTKSQALSSLSGVP